MIGRSAFAAAFVLVASATPSGAATPDFGAFDSVIVQELRASATPGAAIAVVLGDSVVFARGYGVASVETDEPITPQTLFRVASTTKMLVAAAAATLAERGGIDFAKPVASYAEGLDPAIGRLTLHQLLAHRAGLSDESVYDGPHDEAALGAYVRTWGRERFFTEPDRVYSYSNPGYVLAGHVLAEAADTTFEGAMQQLLFRPLGMTRSTTLPTAAMTRPHAQAHDVGADGRPFVVRPFPDDARFRPNGGVFTSAAEFARFALAAVNGGRIGGREALPRGAVERLTRTHGVRPGGDPADTSWIAYGLVGRREEHAFVLQHGGSRLGSGSIVRMIPERRFAVVILTNRTGSYLPRALETITRSVLVEPVTIRDRMVPPPTRVTGDERRDLLGIWVNHEPDLVLELFADGDTLKARQPGDPVAEAASVEKIGPSRYRFARQEITAIPGAGGRTAYLHLAGRALARRAAGE